jgi:hypothetical protein
MTKHKIIFLLLSLFYYYFNQFQDEPKKNLESLTLSFVYFQLGGGGWSDDPVFTLGQLRVSHDIVVDSSVLSIVLRAKK